MYYFISLDSILSFFSSIGLNLADISDYGKSVLFVGCNIFYLITWIFIVYIAYKILMFFKKLFR
jgi:hypothetical protein